MSIDLCFSSLLLQNKPGTSLSHWFEFKLGTILSFAHQCGGGVAGFSGALLAQALCVDAFRRQLGAGLPLTVCLHVSPRARETQTAEGRHSSAAQASLSSCGLAIVQPPVPDISDGS